MIVSVAIGIDSDPKFGKDEGRIVAVRPSGWEWGREEVKGFLILEIDLGTSINTIEDAQKLTVPHFDTGDLWWSFAEDKDGNPIDPPKILSKRRYSIPFSDLDSLAKSASITIDLAKIRSKSVEDQPLKDLAISPTTIFDKVKGNKITLSDLTAINAVGK
jgi:hypothetical protein